MRRPLWQNCVHWCSSSLTIGIGASSIMQKSVDVDGHRGRRADEHFQWLTTDEVVDGKQLALDEIADEGRVTAYALALANTLKIDLSTALQQKMVKNRLKYPVDSAKTAN